MFTGIIEAFGKVVDLKKDQENLHISLESSLTQELKIDQSLAHNGVCLTVVNTATDQYTVTAIQETLEKSNLGSIKMGHLINLERAMMMNSRLDGHIVQGHVDQIGYCTGVDFREGSWFFDFEYDQNQNNITIEKGSICVNGVSLTVVNSGQNQFSVAIIPYTYEHTNFHQIQKGDTVNLEFDMIGKYISKLHRLHV
ncbi:MAG: riboflavin synthase [Bacteroidetes bacterium]|jgi:riboflavin synthase|nr:riboflavin synthase [Flavobacteriaceae bacterium]MBT6127115.1 riboflavin synthase [Flavobacteriaceae bacterium]MDG1027565.1 riboflavin synthase [Flavobacteriaceae bacterium]MDG1942039.1 riboflavin synthase [Flavobacteriaceae bacterium]NCF31886.1 riboflavin synthase [Bacteroidota bacterium]